MKQILAARRAALMQAFDDKTVIVLQSTPVAVRNNDVDHEYRADSDLFYLTGFDEPDCTVILRPGHATHPFAMLVRPRDRAREIWDGERAGVEGAITRFGADIAWPNAERSLRLQECMQDRTRLVYAIGRDRALDQQLMDALVAVRGRDRLGCKHPQTIVDIASVLHEMRWKKSEIELTLMRRAVEITRDAFRSAARLALDGRNEWEVDAALRGGFRSRGAERTAYEPIVASGANACTLHYFRNNRVMHAGELLLIDAGAEFNGYASDITRTFPVGGRFSPAQRAVYDVVLRAQKAALAQVKPGATLEALHAASVGVIAKGLVDLGLLSGTVEELIQTEKYKQFYMHGTSHWLGMDVHDVGAYGPSGVARALEPGCVFTIEPGLYIAQDNDSVPPEFRGIGVRIEDDVVCTEQGASVISHDIPREIDEVEQMVLAHEPS